MPLSKFSVLMGQNDGGKSSVLVAISKFLTADAFEDADHRMTGGNAPSETEETEDEPTRAETMTVEIVIDTPSLCGRLRIARTLGGPTQYEVETDIVGQPDLDQDLRALGRNELRAIAQTKGVLVAGNASQEEFLNKLLEYKMTLPRSVGWRALSPAEIRAACTLTFYDEGAALADPKTAIQKVATDYYNLTFKPQLQEKTATLRKEVQEGLNAHLKQLATDLKEHCDEIESVQAPIRSTSFSEIAFDQIQVTKVGGVPIDWMRLGRGKKREMSLSIFRRQNAILTSALSAPASEGGTQPIIALFDEPDVNLDYPAQRRVAESLTKLAGYDQCQVIAATHSANLIDSVPVDQVTFIGSSVPEPQKRNWRFRTESDDAELTEVLFSAMGLSNTALFNERMFVVCSGETEVACLRVLYPQILKKSLALDGIVLLDGKNDDQACRIAQIFQQNGKRQVLVIDSDAVHGDKAVPRLKDKDFKHAFGLEDVYKLGQREYEDLFDNQVWAAVLNDLPPSVAKEDDPKSWTTADIEALRNEPKFSDAIMKEISVHSTERVSKPELGAMIAKAAVQMEMVPEELQQLLKRVSELSASS